MVHYYSDRNNVIYVYNTETDHWIVKSPVGPTETLALLNSGTSSEELELKKIGKTRACNYLNKQYKDIQETWEYSGVIYKSGKNLITADTSYYIVYYQGNVYPVKSFRMSSGSFILRNGKHNQFEVKVIHCAGIYKKNQDGSYSVYGRTII